MEKMKIGIVTVATLALVAVAVSVLVINSGIVLAVGPVVTAHVGAVLKLTPQGDDVDVEVKAQGLDSDKSFTMRAYTTKNCTAPPLGASDPETSDSNGKLKISKTISDKDVDDVESVSIRITGSPATNPPVVCFQDTTP